MTAPLTAAESFLALLDDLASAKAKPSGAAAAVMLTHAAIHIRGLLEQVQALEGEADDDDDEIAGVFRRAALRCPEHGVLCKGADCCCAGRHQDGPVPGCSGPLPADSADAAGGGRTGSRGDRIAAHGPPDLTHLPPKAPPGVPMCLAESARDPMHELSYFSCTGAAGHPERWHAEHRETDGTPYANEDRGAAWPVVDVERGLPNMALSMRLGCGQAHGRWTCNAVSGHAPLDHVAFSTDERKPFGLVLARWASVQPPVPHLVFRHSLTLDGNRCGKAGPATLVAADVECPECLLWLALQPGGPCDANRPDHDDITQAEHDEAVAHLLSRYGSIPPSLQHVIDMGGRIRREARVPACGALSPLGEMTCNLMAGHLSRHEQLDEDGTVLGAWPNGEANGHALSPPEPPAEDPADASFPHLAPVPPEPGDDGKRCTCQPDLCRGGECEACAGFGECVYVDAEVTP